MTATRATGPTALPRIGGAVPFAEPPRRARVEQVMGLPVSVHVRGPRARGPEVGRVAPGGARWLADAWDASIAPV